MGSNVRVRRVRGAGVGGAFGGGARSGKMLLNQDTPVSVDPVEEVVVAVVVVVTVLGVPEEPLAPESAERKTRINSCSRSNSRSGTDPYRLVRSWENSPASRKSSVRL